MRVSSSRTRISIMIRADEEGPGTLVLSGTISESRRTYREWVRLGDANAAGRSALERLLEASGVVLEGGVAEGGLPSEELVTLHAHRSRPLAELVRVVNKHSSNFGAEMLLRHLALSGDVKTGSTEGGLEVLRRCATSWGLQPDGVVLADGSGYSRANRLSAESLVSTLLHAAHQPSWYPEWLSSLPRSGEDGSLRKRLSGLDGRLRAKTGSLSGVAALAGVGLDGEGEEFAFAVLLNGKRGSVGSADLDRLVGLLFEVISERCAERSTLSVD